MAVLLQPHRSQNRLLLADPWGAGYKSPVRLAIDVAAPPGKPVLIFDGDCNFCRRWVWRWRHDTGDKVDYIPFQDGAVAARFPELARERFETAVHLVEADGAVYRGAEAALRALAHTPGEPWLLDWYLRSPAFARVSESTYRFIAGHRQLFSTLTRLAWGQHLEPPSHLLVRWLFLRSLGIIYLIAFLSLWVQVQGLIGSQGILPAKLTMEAFRQQADAAKVGWDRYHLLPTVCWLNVSDGFLNSQCAAGAGLAVLLILGIAPAPCLFLLWLIYLSLAGVSREFLSFQWDNLLLETGFLAIFFAPLQLLPGFSRAPPPSRLVLWLLRWLLFRLMVGSGLVKLLSGDPAWRHLTALKFHYETQPLPTWVGWYAHQLPLRLQQVSTAVLFVVELLLPFLIFAPRRLRQFACVAFVGLQILIFLTGNYCFFNLLTVLLCLVLLDDAALQKVIPGGWLALMAQRPQPRLDCRTNREIATGPNASPGQPLLARLRRWPIQVTFPLTCIGVLIPAIQFGGLFQVRLPWPRPMVAVYGWLVPFRSFNNYGLFAVMTTTRPEIIIQGSNDGVIWKEYDFKYKPGELKRRPRFVEPHQPRLDWQMWFAALGDYRHNLWFVEFCVRLLNGSPDVLELLQGNPFPNAPPRYLRAVVYEYHFTDFATRRRTGTWWRREEKGEYLPVLTLRHEDQRQPESSKNGPANSDPKTTHR